MTEPDYQFLNREDDQHVVPRSDEVQHELTERCVCGAEVHEVIGDGVILGLIVVHSSLDGRELDEPNYLTYPGGPLGQGDI